MRTDLSPRAGRGESKSPTNLLSMRHTRNSFA
jgi:hypothetical protein